MSQLGKLHHLAICVSDMQRSEKFYASVLEHLGYAAGQEMKDESISKHVPGAKNTFTIWTGPGGAFSIWPKNPAASNQNYEMYSPGLHHLALAADSREQVDKLHRHLQKIGANILDEPAEYDYMPGFYAVYFTDPDGIKLELAHTGFSTGVVTTRSGTRKDARCATRDSRNQRVRPVHVAGLSAGNSSCARRSREALNK